MKQLWNRFCRWLIRKLGGYDVQYIHHQHVHVHNINVKPILYKAEVKISKYHWQRSNVDLLRMAKHELAMEIANGLVRDGFINLSTREEMCDDTVVLRGEVAIIDAHTMAKVSWREWDAN